MFLICMGIFDLWGGGPECCAKKVETIDGL